jgi:hypothetical protein
LPGTRTTSPDDVLDVVDELVGVEMAEADLGISQPADTDGGELVQQALADLAVEDLHEGGLVGREARQVEDSEGRLEPRQVGAAGDVHLDQTEGHALEDLRLSAELRGGVDLDLDLASAALFHERLEAFGAHVTRIGRVQGVGQSDQRFGGCTTRHGGECSGKRHRGQHGQVRDGLRKHHVSFLSFVGGP